MPLLHRKRINKSKTSGSILQTVTLPSERLRTLSTELHLPCITWAVCVFGCGRAEKKTTHTKKKKTRKDQGEHLGGNSFASECQGPPLAPRLAVSPSLNFPCPLSMASVFHSPTSFPCDLCLTSVITVPTAAAFKVQLGWGTDMPHHLRAQTRQLGRLMPRQFSFQPNLLDTGSRDIFVWQQEIANTDCQTRVSYFQAEDTMKLMSG